MRHRRPSTSLSCKPYSCGREKGVAVRCVSAVPNRKKNQQTNKRERERERRQRVAFDKYKRNEKLIHRRMQAIILISSRSQHKKKNRNTFKNLRIFSSLFSPSTCLPVFNSIDRKFYTKKRKKRKQDSCQSNGQTRSWLLIREIKIQLHPKKEPRFIFFVCLLVSFRSGLIDMRLVYDYQKLLLYYSYYSSTVCPRSFGRSQVVSEQIFNRQYYFSSFYWFHYQTSALFFFFLSPFHSRAVQRKKKGKKNQARRLQCLINTGSRRVCV